MNARVVAEDGESEEKTEWRGNSAETMKQQENTLEKEEFCENGDAGQSIDQEMVTVKTEEFQEEIDYEDEEAEEQGDDYSARRAMEENAVIRGEGKTHDLIAHENLATFQGNVITVEKKDDEEFHEELMIKDVEFYDKWGYLEEGEKENDEEEKKRREEEDNDGENYDDGSDFMIDDIDNYSSDCSDNNSGDDLIAPEPDNQQTQMNQNDEPNVVIDDEVSNNDENEIGLADYNNDNDNILPAAENPNWVRVYPPEVELNVEGEFNAQNVGPRNCPPRNSPPLTYFYLFFTQTIWNLFVEKTNKYADGNFKNKRNSGNMHRFSRLQNWIGTTVPEIKKYIALIVNMGLIPRNNIEKYWSTKRSQSMPFFPSVMSLKRFQLISSVFHTSLQLSIPAGQQGHDPWFKIRPLLDHMNVAFKKYFIPSQNICIDESMIGMKNRLVHIVYMPNKRHARFGIKKFEVVDSKYSYILHTELYSGKQFLAKSRDPFMQKVIMFLLRSCNLLNKSYHIFTDNFFTKIPLANELLVHKTFLTGIVNKRSEDLSKEILNTQIPPQSSLYYRKNKILMLGYKVKKTRESLYFISTGCHAEDSRITSRSGKVNMEPVMIKKHNLCMGGVHNKGKSIYHVTCSRGIRRYWKKMFYNLLDMAIFNAYILYSLNTDKPMGREEFMETIVEQLIEDSQPKNEPQSPMPGPTGGLKHELLHLPDNKLRICVVCSTAQKKSRSSYWCSGCNCGVHTSCFHKLKHFWRPVGLVGKRGAPGDDLPIKYPV